MSKFDNIAGMIDHSLLRPEATINQVIQLCRQAKKYRFASVCVNPCYIPVCVEELKGSGVKTCAVIGFPFGATSTATKIFEVKEVLRSGADEIDMVINIGMLKSGNTQYVEDEISSIVKLAHKSGAIVKVIIETALLTKKEIIEACLITKHARADFVKTSTGFSKSGATSRNVALMRKTVGQKIGIKASGGIRSLDDALAMISSGADRIGTSEGVKLINEFINMNNRQQFNHNGKK
jgi:deoxyribose-phosphate aldolase